MSWRALKPQRWAEAFVLERAHGSKEGVLELFSGSGKLSRALDQAALEVVAVEPTEPLQAISVASAGDRVVLLRQDPRSLRLGRRFGLVLALGAGLRRLSTLDDLEAVFATAAYHLSEDGSLVVEIDGMDQQPRATEHILLDRRAGFIGVRADASTSRRILAPHLTRRGEHGARLSRLSLLSVAANEVFDRLSAAGLTVVERYSDYNLTPFDPTGRRLVAVCRKGSAPSNPGTESEPGAGAP